MAILKPAWPGREDEVIYGKLIGTYMVVCSGCGAQFIVCWEEIMGLECIEFCPFCGEGIETVDDE